MITVRPARREELERVIRLIDTARQRMIAAGNPHQWPEGYPRRDTVAEGIRRGATMLCFEDDRAIATFTLLPGPDATYRHIDGRWLDDRLPYHVIHRIAARPEAKGVFAAILRHVALAAPNLRIDTHRDNAAMLHLLHRHGFTRCGTIRVENGTERIAFQRITRETSRDF